MTNLSGDKPTDFLRKTKRSSYRPSVEECASADTATAVCILSSERTGNPQYPKPREILLLTAKWVTLEIQPQFNSSKVGASIRKPWVHVQFETTKEKLTWRSGGGR